MNDVLAQRLIRVPLVGGTHQTIKRRNHVSYFGFRRKEKMDAHNAKQDAAIAGLAGDLTEMKALIAQLQNSPGPISAEDQATLDRLEAKAGASADSLEALDALTPPVVPTV